MITLQETLASQDDLQSLCADRPLRTREAFAPNAYYGNGRILKQYAELPDAYALKAVLPHGIIFDESFVWVAEATAPVPAVFCWPPYRAQAYATLAAKKVFLSAAPFLYVVELLKDQPRPPRQGTLFFPHHSTHHITAETDFDRLARELENLEPAYQPVTVCIYWKDYQLGHHLPFQKRGLRVVSAGHMYDPEFLFRFYHLCSVHRYAAANGLGSNLFYSVKAGCSYFYVDSVEPHLRADDQVRERDLSGTPLGKERVLKDLFSERRPATTAEQLREVDYYLGADHLKSPSDLRKQLLQAELLDKVSFASGTRAGATRLAVPAFFRRSARGLGRRLLDIAHKIVTYADKGAQAL